MKPKKAFNVAPTSIFLYQKNSLNTVRSKVGGYCKAIDHTNISKKLIIVTVI
jgi:hypothetical protein